ncbi:MAG: UMP kinase [Planctomycetota bacterium]|nr:UMP kinase [Planctomycetota bacterium]
MAAYKRILLKLSGEALGGESARGLDKAALQMAAGEIRDVCSAGIELAVVVGAGNFVRGAESAALGIERATADYMGMAATLLNALALQSAVEAMGYSTRVLTAIKADEMAEPYIRRRAMRHMEKGRVVILAGGTGNPYCTTDTAAALRAIELDCKAILKATKVDGVYTNDPLTNPNALRYDSISYSQAIRENLRIMDSTAFTMCQENRVPIIVYSMKIPGNTIKAAIGQTIGTTVAGG